MFTTVRNETFFSYFYLDPINFHTLMIEINTKKLGYEYTA